MRPWSQFLIYADTVARTDGARTLAAMLRDKRLLPSFEKQLERQSDESPRPDLVGHDRTAQGLHNIHVAVLRLLQATTRNPNIELPKGPVYPAEVIEHQQDAAEIEAMNRDIAEANRRHREKRAKEVNADG